LQIGINPVLLRKASYGGLGEADMSEMLSGDYDTVQTLAAGMPAVTVSGTINAYGTVGRFVGEINGAAATFTAEAALFGPSTGHFTISNSGLIESHGSAPDNVFDVGIVLGAAGTVRNSGTILGGSGIAVFPATGNAYIENSKLIEGSFGVGVIILGTTGTSATVVNSGTIIGSPIDDDGAIEIFGNGAVTNASGGTLIAEASYAIGGQEGAVTVTNSGAITGFFGGINLQGGGFVTNAGYIHATGTGATLSNSSYVGINSDLGGTVFNSGTVLGQNGIDVHYGNGTITTAIQGYARNSGLIKALSTNALQNADAGNFGVGIELQMPGTVVNAGSITASNAGIYTQNGVADVQNLQHGTIISQIGIDLSASSANGTLLANVGYVENLGAVQAYSSTNVTGNFSNGFPKIGVGVYLAAAGTVVNHGTIAGNHAGIVIENHPGTVTNTGTITSSRGYGVYLNVGGTVSNTGSIIGYQQGIFIGSPAPNQATVNSVRSISNDGFVDATAMIISTTVGSSTYTGLGDAIFVIGAATIDNQINGTVEAKYGGGIDLFAAADNYETGQVDPVAGAIINAGTVKAKYGVYLFAIGSLTNTGTIIGEDYGFESGNTAASGTNSGLIEASAGAFVNVVGTTTMSGVGTAVVVKAGGNFTNTSTGTITAAAGYGVNLAAGGSLNNAGTINGYIAGVLLKQGGSVSNSGTIAGTSSLANAINALNAPLIVNNTGLISGTGTFSAIYMQDSGTVTNHGTILGQSSTPVYAGKSLAGTVINYGLIHTTGTGASGIYWVAGGTVTNHSLAVISGYSHGVYMRGTNIAAVTNSGTISGFGTQTASGTGIGLYSSIANLVSNAAAGVIEGVETGISITNATGFISNAGTITGRNTYGIYLGAGGSVNNAGTIIAYRDGIRAKNMRATIVNSGFINATASTFVTGGTSSSDGLPPGTYVSHGIAIGNGSITNTSSGTVIGAAGIVINGTSSGGYLLNAGHVTATARAGLYLKSSGTIVNAGSVAAYRAGLEVNDGGIIINTGIASGKTGVNVDSLASATVINAGTITGTSGVAIDFGNTLGASTLIDDPGAVFNGKVENADGLGFLSLESAAATGTLQNFGTLFTGFDDIEIAGGATWEIAGATSIGPAIRVINEGTLTETGADALTISGAITGTGLIILDPTTITLNGSVAAGQNVSFANTGDVLDLGDASQFNGTITDFGTGDTINLTDTPFASITGETFLNGVLTLSEAAGSITLTFANPSIFQESPTLIAAGGGIDITAMTAPCFAAGTRLLTASGALVPVEALQAGDELELFSGDAAPIIWIGRRTLDLQLHPRPEAVQPILITAGALGHGLPWRDLIVSPDHAMYLDGHLIPAKALLNGFSIRQLNRKRVTYYHIELSQHAVLFAEGAPAESYLETGNRAAFENAGNTIRLHPSFAQTIRHTNGCAPFAESGPAVEAVRQRILDRAGIETTDDPAWHIRYKNGAAIIASRAAIPGEIFADPRDRRRLGVKIATLRIGGELIPLSHPLLVDGWHAPEQDGSWTNGHAVIPKSLLQGSRQIDIKLAGTLRYPCATATAWQAGRA
jgi:hypothetical protein